MFNVCVQASFSPGLLKSISHRKAKAGFFCVRAGGLVGIVGVSVGSGGEGGAMLGCLSVGVGASWYNRVGLLLLGSDCVFGSL